MLVLGSGNRPRVYLRQVIRHNLIELSLGDVAEFEVLDFNALSGVPDLVNLRLHLVKVTLQSLLTLLVGEFDLFETPCQLFLLLFLGQIGLIHPF